jgi:hypothetical protein
MHNSRPLGVLILFLAGFSLAGCSTSKTFNSVQTLQPIGVNGTLEDWPTESLQIQNSPEYDIYFSNDSEFLYVFLTVKSNQLFEEINRYGLQLFFDTNRREKRTFGVVYPIGLLNGLNDFPGARKDYLENPGWGNLRENQAIIESINREMPNRVMLIQRNSKRDALRPVPVNMDALRAQQLEVAMSSDARRLSIEMKIPLQSSRARQFAIDVERGKPIFFGLEVVPPTVDEIEDDSYSAQQNMNPRDPYNRNMQRQQDNARRLQSQLQGGFSRWMRVELSR